MNRRQFFQATAGVALMATPAMKTLALLRDLGAPNTVTFTVTNITPADRVVVYLLNKAGAIDEEKLSLEPVRVTRLRDGAEQVDFRVPSTILPRQALVVKRRPRKASPPTEYTVAQISNKG